MLTDTCVGTEIGQKFYHGPHVYNQVNCALIVFCLWQQNGKQKDRELNIVTCTLILKGFGKSPTEAVHFNLF